MDVEMETTLVIVWLTGVVCGTAFFFGLSSFVYFFWKKYKDRLIFPFIAMIIGFSGMSNGLFTLLRLVRSWIVT
jgi:hypothetical protein